MSSLWIHESQDVYTDDNYYVFARGEYIIALSSRGQAAARESLELKDIPGRFIGDTLTNVLDPKVRFQACCALIGFIFLFFYFLHLPS
jgi:hypothetical protein